MHPLPALGARVLVVVLKELWWGGKFGWCLLASTARVTERHSAAQSRIHVGKYTLFGQEDKRGLWCEKYTSEKDKLLCKGESQINIVTHVINIFISANNGFSLSQSILALGQSLLIPRKTSGSDCLGASRVSCSWVRSQPSCLRLRGETGLPLAKAKIFPGGT